MLCQCYLSLRWIHRSPVVGSELVKLIKLEADVLNGQLQHVPETSQVRGHRARVRVWVLQEDGTHKTLNSNLMFNNKCGAEMRSIECLQNTHLVCV